MLPRHLDRYALAGLLAILLWSSTVAVARSLSEQLGARTAMAAVYLTGAFAFCVRAWCTGQPVIDLRGVGRAYLFGCGGLFVFYTYALFQSVALAGNRMQVLEVGMLNYLWPTLTLLLSLVLLNRRATWLLAPGTALALSGEFLVLSHEGGFSWIGAFSHVQARPAAYGLGLAAGVSWALYSTLTRRWSGPETRGGGTCVRRRHGPAHAGAAAGGGRTEHVDLAGRRRDRLSGFGHGHRILRLGSGHAPGQRRADCGRVLFHPPALHSGELSVPGCRPRSPSLGGLRDPHSRLAVELAFRSYPRQPQRS